MKKYLAIGVFTVLMTGCGESTNYDTLAACEKIPLIERDAGICSCISDSLGDSKEVVNLMNWLSTDKEKDQMGFPLAGWIAQVSKDPERESQLESLMEPLGEEGMKNFGSCLWGQ